MRFSLEALTVVILVRPAFGFTFVHKTRKTVVTLNVGQGGRENGNEEGRAKANEDEDEGERSSAMQGGNRLRRLMEQAEIQKHRLPDPNASIQNMYPDDYGDAPIVDVAPASSPVPAQSTGRNFDALAADGRQSIGDVGPPVVSAGSDAPPPPRRREQIANTSDLYLEQLKADTKFRKEAFLLGDHDGHQQVWVDPKIKELENKIVENPYFQSEKERQKEMMAMFEPTEEELVIQELEEKEAETKKFSTGVSYKERLAAKRNKVKAKPAESKSPPIILSATEEKPQKGAFLVKVSEPETTKKPEPDAIPTSVPNSEDEVKPVEQIQSEQEFVMELPEPIQNPTEVTKQSGTEPVDDETARRTFRTLMGLILKHKGGPGFGSGYLKGPESKRFENTLAEVTDMLRGEIDTSITSVVEESLSIEPEQSSMRDIPITSAAKGLAFPLDGSLECVDAIVTMYRESSPEKQANLLLPLRDALASAITRCNLLIDADDANDQVKKQENTSEVESLGDITSRMDFSAVDAKTTKVDNNPSSALFQKSRDALLAMRGDGEYGMKDTCTEEEANDLVELLRELRFALVEELESDAA